MVMSVCPNCFGDKYNPSQGVCPVCGYSAFNDEHVTDRGLAPGTVLNNRYVIGRVLGSGGFGITYKAYDFKTNAVCCVKEYAPQDFCIRKPGTNTLVLLSKDFEPPYTRGMRRFMDEAEILARLSGVPTVVHVTDGFRENDTAYFAMEYLDGRDLKTIAKENGGILPAKWVNDVIIQAAMALDIVHNKSSIIHRDISPDNIFITNDGRVKIIDFGSAKQTSGGVREGLSVVLKFGYAPLEQYSSTSTQGAFTDVYSLAATYYYCVTGKHIPKAPDRSAGVEYDRLKTLNLGISPAVSDAIDHALKMSVKERTPNMQTFIAELCRDMQGDGGQRPTTQNAGPRPYIVVRIAGTPPAKYELPIGKALTIGRSIDAGITISTNDLDVSRIHFEVQYIPENGSFHVKDRSMNGVYAGNMRLGKDVLYQVQPPVQFMLAKAAYVIELGVN